LLDDVPFMWLDLVVLQLHIASVSNLVNCILIFIDKVKHIIGSIPMSLDIMWHHMLLLDGNPTKYETQS